MIVIAGIALPPMVELLVQINVSAEKVVPFVKPNTLAVEMLEEIKGKRWDENWIGGPLADAEKTAPSALGADSGETGRADFDDMDDYKDIQPVPQDAEGNPLPAYADYTVQVQVYYVFGIGDAYPLTAPANFDFVTPVTTNPPSSDYKRIDVTITKNTGETFSASTIVCNY